MWPFCYNFLDFLILSFYFFDFSPFFCLFLFLVLFWKSSWGWSHPCQPCCCQHNLDLVGNMVDVSVFDLRWRNSEQVASVIWLIQIVLTNSVCYYNVQSSITLSKPWMEGKIWLTSYAEWISGSLLNSSNSISLTIESIDLADYHWP